MDHRSSSIIISLRGLAILNESDMASIHFDQYESVKKKNQVDSNNSSLTIDYYTKL